MSIWRVTLTAAFRGMLMQNVLHFNDKDSGITPQTVCEKMRDVWIPEWKFFSVDQVIWINIAATVIHPALGITQNLAVNIPCTGNATAATDHPSICEKVKVQTATPGRHGRGRIYAPCASLAGGNVGVVNVATLNSRNARLQTLLNHFGDGSPPLEGIVYGIIDRHNPGAFHPAISMTLDSKYGLQRRRNIGVGI